MVEYQGIHWLSDDEWAKAEGQLRLQLNGVFSPFKMYGLDVFVPGATEQTVKL